MFLTDRDMMDGPVFFFFGRMGAINWERRNRAARDGTPLKGPMGYAYYAKMTDADLDAVVAYLRTLPPKE